MLEMEADDPLCGTPKGSAWKKKEAFMWLLPPSVVIPKVIIVNEN